MSLEALRRYEALVYVSGDGLLHEIINGLYARRDVPDFPTIGVIPTGSGNAIASALCYRSG